MLKNFLKKMFLSSKGEFSMTKLGGTIVAVSGAIIAVPPAATQAGIHIVIPGIVTTIAWLTVFIGGKLGIDGARDALDKNK